MRKFSLGTGSVLRGAGHLGSTTLNIARARDIATPGANRNMAAEAVSKVCNPVRNFAAAQIKVEGDRYPEHIEKMTGL